MTTTVTINAHCNNDTKVIIKTIDKDNPQPEIHLNDGESHQAVVFDDRSISIKEQPK